MKKQIRCSLIILSILFLNNCAPQSSADYRLVEHIEEVRLPVDSDMELLSSLEHQRQPKSQSKKNEQNKRRLRSLFRTLCSNQDPDFLLSQKTTDQPFVQTNPPAQPGLLRLGVIVGHSSIHVYDAFR